METLFSEQVKLVANALDVDLQTSLLGKPVGDGAWIDKAAKEASRISILAGLVFALKGSYSDSGINQWFRRARQDGLDGKAPVDVLNGDWNADTPYVPNVISLALYHAGPGAAGPALC